MNKPGKNFWRSLWITIVVLCAMFGCTIYFAFQERRYKEEFYRKDTERRVKIRQGLELSRRHNDSIRHSMKNKKRNAVFEAGKEGDDDKDPYDDPDFDDLFPGEEYDEEYVDGSTGDLELYDMPNGK